MEPKWSMLQPIVQYQNLRSLQAIHTVQAIMRCVAKLMTPGSFLPGLPPKQQSWGGQQAARVLAEIQVNKLKSQGQEVDPEAEQTLYDKIKNRYDEQESAYYAAARLWVDAIISPIHTREWISIGIEMSSYAKVEKFNVGVIQVQKIKQPTVS